MELDPIKIRLYDPLKKRFFFGDESMRRFLSKYREMYSPLYDRVVFTNGCFDLLHPGHLTTLRHAALQARGGNVIVGLNSDKSVAKLKGPDRPIMDQDTRAEMILATHLVSHVVVFDDDTPEDLIETLQPNIVVKGGDWNPDDVKYSAASASIAPYNDRWSTTKIIEKIRSGS